MRVATDAVQEFKTRYEAANRSLDALGAEKREISDEYERARAEMAAKRGDLEEKLMKVCECCVDTGIENIRISAGESSHTRNSVSKMTFSRNSQHSF